MDAYLRLNWVVKQGANTSMVVPPDGPFTSQVSGQTIDFTGYTASLAIGQYGQSPPTLLLSTIASANGAVLLNAPTTGFVTLQWTPVGAQLLAAVARSFTHFLKAQYIDGTEIPLIVGATMVAPGW